MGRFVRGGTWVDMIRVIIELSLKFPYKISMDVLTEFCCLWNCRIFSAGTQKRIAIIAMPAHHFKTIFGTNPREREFDVPSGTEHFIEALKVKDIIVK